MMMKETDFSWKKGQEGNIMKRFSLPLNAGIGKQDSHNVLISVAKINLYNLDTV